MERVAAVDPSAQAAAQETRAPPEAELPPGADLYWDAFWALTHDRPQTGMGVHSIPLSAIDSYARRRGIELEEFDALVSLVRACDDEFVTIMAARINASSKEAS